MEKMTAMASLTNKNMAYLNLTAGLVGALLFNVVLNGIDNFSVDKKIVFIALAVLVARLVTDFAYDKLVSTTDMFGGSLLEFVASSAVWFVIIHYLLPDITMKNKIALYSSTVVAMLAIARLTQWA